MPNNEQLIGEYVTYRKLVLKRSPKTAELEKYNLKKLAKFIGKTKFRDVDEKSMQSFFATIDNLRSKNTIAVHIRTYYRWHLGLKKRFPFIILVKS